MTVWAIVVCIEDNSANAQTVIADSISTNSDADVRRGRWGGGEGSGTLRS